MYLVCFLRNVTGCRRAHSDGLLAISDANKRRSNCFITGIFSFQRDVERFTPRSVWNWSKQFSSNDIQFFTNPLYKFSKLKTETVDQLKKRRDRGQPSETALLPEHGLRYMKTWTLCYFRWLPVLGIKSGGLPQIDIVHRQLMNDINSLVRILRECTKSNVGTCVFSNNNNLNNNNNINSSDNKKSCPESNRSAQEDGERESSSAADFISILFHKRDLIDNFFPFSIDSSSYVSNPFANSSNLSEFDSQSVLNLTE